MFKQGNLLDGKTGGWVVGVRNQDPDIFFRLRVRKLQEKTHQLTVRHQVIIDIGHTIQHLLKELTW